jgi:hypothetical protein
MKRDTHLLHQTGTHKFVGGGLMSARGEVERRSTAVSGGKPRFGASFVRRPWRDQSSCRESGPRRRAACGCRATRPTGGRTEEERRHGKRLIGEGEIPGGDRSRGDGGGQRKKME